MTDNLDQTAAVTAHGASSQRSIQIVGPGRAGRSFAAALASVGWRVAPIAGRLGHDALPPADGILLCVPDDAVAEVAAQLPATDTPVLHVSGSRGLAELAPHRSVGSVHPLVSLPNPDIGAARLLDNCFFAVAGHALSVEIAEALGGRWATVNDAARPLYHAAATIASNHVVALAAQVESVAASSGLDPEPFYDLMISTLENVRSLGPSAALTGPASRGDWDTIRHHLDAVEPRHRALYLAAFNEAVRLVPLTPPEDLT